MELGQCVWSERSHIAGI